jgi:hypothetical protein
VSELNAYEFQTEQLLTATGLNIYDGALRAMSLALASRDTDVSILN